MSEFKDPPLKSIWQYFDEPDDLEAQALVEMRGYTCSGEPIFGIYVDIESIDSFGNLTYTQRMLKRLSLAEFAALVKQGKLKPVGSS